MAILGAIGLVLLVFLIYAAVFAFDTYLLSVHVPTLVDDPSNFGAWGWVVFAVLTLVSLASYQTKDSK